MRGVVPVDVWWSREFEGCGRVWGFGGKVCQLGADDISGGNVVDSRVVGDTGGPEVVDEVESYEEESDLEEGSSDFDCGVDNDYDYCEVDEGVDGIGGKCVDE